MTPFNKEKSSLDRILWVVIFIGMVAGSLGGPFSLGAFILMPVPLIVLNVLISPVNAAVLIAGASVLFTVKHGIMAGAAFFLLIGLFSVLQSFMIRRSSPVSRILFWGVVFVLGANLLLIPIGNLTQDNTSYMFLESLGDNLKTAILTSDYGDNLSSADLSGFFPFFILYLIFIFNASNFFLSRWVLKNKGLYVIPLDNLSDFQLPGQIMAGVLLMLAMGYGLKTAEWNAGQALFDTLLYLSAFIFMFQGLALCAFLLKRQGIPSVWQALILTSLLLLAGPIGLGLAGFTDVLIDLRKQRRAGGNPG